jgi:hypothetical protein
MSDKLKPLTEENAGQNTSSGNPAERPAGFNDPQGNEEERPPDIIVDNVQ